MLCYSDYVLHKANEPITLYIYSAARDSVREQTLFVTTREWAPGNTGLGFTVAQGNLHQLPNPRSLGCNEWLGRERRPVSKTRRGPLTDEAVPTASATQTSTTEINIESSSSATPHRESSSVQRRETEEQQTERSETASPSCVRSQLTMPSTPKDTVPAQSEEPKARRTEKETKPKKQGLLGFLYNLVGDDEDDVEEEVEETVDLVATPKREQPQGNRARVDATQEGAPSSLSGTDVSAAQQFYAARVTTQSSSAVPSPSGSAAAHRHTPSAVPHGK